MGLFVCVTLASESTCRLLKARGKHKGSCSGSSSVFLYQQCAKKEASLPSRGLLKLRTLVRLQVREVLERLMEDDGDMLRMCLTRQSLRR